MTLEEFDHIVNVDYRGSWLCSREELKIMVNQEPLENHSGRQANRGVIVNVASQLGIVARPQARKSTKSLFPSLFARALLSKNTDGS